MTAFERFRAFAMTIMNEHSFPQEHWDAVNGLYDFYYEISGRSRDVTDTDAPKWQEETILPGGKAIDPYSAATCILDLKRTSAFARGVRSAIAAARTRFPGETIELLYAGTGPFAPLALLQTPFYAPDEIRFNLLDIHPAALDCLATVISTLGLERYVGTMIQADASVWRPPDDDKYHVIVAEVMQRALTKEPQVAVTLNVAKLLHPNGTLVPERVELQPCLLDPSKEQSVAEDHSLDPPPVVRQRLNLGPPFVLSADSADRFTVTDEGYIELPDLCLPAQIEANHEIKILTRIVTFGDIAIDDYQSGLTFLHDPFGEFNTGPGMKLEMRYILGSSPGITLGTRSGIQ